MDNETSEKRLPIPLIRAHLHVKRWRNLAVDGVRPLITPKLLIGVNAALDAYVQMIKGKTVPGLSTDERIVPPTRKDDWWLINDAILPDIAVFDRVQASLQAARLRGVEQRTPSLRRLKDEWNKLENQWPSILAEAQRRLGAAFQADDFPLHGELWKKFIAWGQFSDEGESDSLVLLGRFSTFHKPDVNRPRPSDMFAAFDLAHGLTELRAQRAASRPNRASSMERP